MIENVKDHAGAWVVQQRVNGASVVDLAIVCAFKGLVPPAVMEEFVRAHGPVSPECVQDAIEEHCVARGFW